MIQRIIETKSDEMLQRIMSILIEDTAAEDPFKSLNATQLEVVGRELDLADEDIAAGRVHSQEAIAEWIENLD